MFPPTPCACAHGTPSAAPPLTDLGVHRLAAQAGPAPASVPRTALRQNEVGFSNPLRRFCTRQTRFKLVRPPTPVGIRRAARLTSEPRCAATAAARTRDNGCVSGRTRKCVWAWRARTTIPRSLSGARGYYAGVQLLPEVSVGITAGRAGLG